MAIEEPDVAITLICPDSFTGSSFRDNSLIKGNQLAERGKKATAQEIADMTMFSADRRVAFTSLQTGISLKGYMSQTSSYLAPELRLKLLRKVTIPAPKL